MYSSNLSDLLSPPPTLRRGDKGDDVCRLQYLISGLKIDGDFGYATFSAVKALQSKHGLTADGIVGKATWAVIMAGRPDSFYAYPGCSTFTGSSTGSTTWTEIMGNIFGSNKSSTDTGKTSTTPVRTSTSPIFSSSGSEPAQSPDPTIGIFGWTMLGIAAASTGAILYNKKKSKKASKSRRRGSSKKSSVSRPKKRKNVRAIIYE